MMVYALYNCSAKKQAYSSNDEVSISPNPFSDGVNIQAKSGMKMLEISNTQGEALSIFYPHDETEMFVNFDKWSNGVYFVKITCKNGMVVTKKVVKI